MTDSRSISSRGAGQRLALLLALILGSTLVLGDRSSLRADEPAAIEYFEKAVRPLLVERCQSCHNAEKSKGGLRLTDREALLKGGESGQAVVPGKPEESLLIRAVGYVDEPKMPPKRKLSDVQIAVLVKWVKTGAVWPRTEPETSSARVATPEEAKPLLTRTTATFTDQQRSYWAFQPVKDPPPPAVKDAAVVRSPIDAFVLAKLEERGLTPAPAAEKRTLIRRVTFDLTGLPPLPAEIDAFLADDSPRAFSSVVDRLLSSPHYGEHWGRHWLDVARYAETTANDANAVMRFAFRYRDYVVDAFNRDLPYDQFVIEQLAGDLLPRTGNLDQIARQVVATGFLMVGPKALAETDKEQTRIDIVDEQLDVTSRAFLGLTLACARCHDHKFDPLPTTDYYALAGVFRSTEPLQDEARNNTMFQEYPLKLPNRRPLMVMAVKEALPRDLRVHVRGNRFQLGQLVPRRLPLILTGGIPTPIETKQSGRLELARWIASPSNPLTARVMVNRIWQHHFGTGLVATSDNFGTRGDPPSHAALLDWLATRFVRSGWSVKSMHRLLLNSSTYQRAAGTSPVALRNDPGNRLVSHMPRRRLSAEEVRDAMLAVSGQLDRKIGGGDSAEVLYKEAEVQDAKRGFAPNRMQSDHPFYDTPRRSLYLPVVRNAQPDALALFDAADPNAVTTARNDTTVPSQSLYLMNSSFVRDQSRQLGKRLLEDSRFNDTARIGLATLYCLGRAASDAETTAALAYLERFVTELETTGTTPEEAKRAAWQSFCQVLLCSNEFLYVD
ncbi:MAG: PSD1 and planctomycete cytochrome C domain-containing protein [Isosphaerales bacterium]